MLVRHAIWSALDRLIRKIVYADPELGYVYLLKADVSDGFYRIGLRPQDAPKLVLGRAPGGAKTGTAPVRHGTHPFPPSGVCLDDLEGAVGGAPLLGSQRDAGT